MFGHQRVYNLLRKRILEGPLSPGERLPTEHALAERYGVSRITVRHALRLLKEQGLVESCAGRGTFVRSTTPAKIPILDYDFVGSMRRAAPAMTRKLLLAERRRPPPRIATMLGTLPNERCFYAERVDVVDAEPLAFDRCYLPPALSGSVDERMLVRVDFLDAWRAAEGVSISHAVESIEVGKAGPEAAGILGVPRGSPLLLTVDVMHSSETALAVFESFYRGDRFKLVSTHSWKAVHDRMHS
jgi:GntR family transcriptional regulator